MVIDKFVDPYTGQALIMDSEGNLQREDGSVIYKCYDGCYDFVIADHGLKHEKNHYDKEYAGINIRPLTTAMVANAWFDEIMQWYRTLLDSLGDISGKRILLLGNGGSSRELYFVHLGANVVFSDLSIAAVRHMKHTFMLSEIAIPGNNTIEFHAIDAMHLPYPDRSFDIIYGSAFVHHLDDLDPFFSEVYRCLNNKGICRFLDQADSPLWTTMKQTILRPIQLYSYWKYPRSPEDLKAASREVFNKDFLVSLMKKHRFNELFFFREWFFLSITWRHYGKLVGWNPDSMKSAEPFFLLLKRLDTWLSKYQWMKNNQLMLIWGFNK